MTFEEDERDAYPPSAWKNKEPKEETFSKEIHGFTTDHLEETSAVYDPGTETIRNEIRFGVCSMCKESIFRNNSAVCFYGDQICRDCKISFMGRSVCRMHVESHIGGKDEAVVLVGISVGLSKEKVKCLSSLSRKRIDSAKARLVERAYIKTGSYGLLSKFPKVTPVGLECMHAMIAAYHKDPDFGLYLQRIGWIKNVETGKKQ